MRPAGCLVVSFVGRRAETTILFQRSYDRFFQAKFGNVWRKGEGLFWARMGRKQKFTVRVGAEQKPKRIAESAGIQPKFSAVGSLSRSNRNQNLLILVISDLREKVHWA
jgi:hypothetical protein